MDLSLRIADPGWRREIASPAALCRRAVRAAVAEGGGAKGGDISLLLTGDSEVARLNMVWRGKSGPTNVLSFPADGEDGGGDIAIALETTRREAAEQGSAPDRHLAHLVVHGVLHLLGFRHDSDEAAERMERRETAALARLDMPDPHGTRP